MKDYYKILEVSPGASQDEIKKAYRKLALLYHPDRNSSLHAQTLIQEINLAYDVIGDARKRAAYDLRFKNYKTYQNSNSGTVRKKPHGAQTPAGKPVRKSERFDYTDWALKGRFISGFILFYCSMLCLDYFISSTYKNTVITSFDVTAYKSKRTTSHYSFNIQSSKVDFELISEAHMIKVGDTLDVNITPLFGIVKNCASVVNGAPREMRFLISFYSPVMFLVFILMALNVAAIAVKNAELSFNYSVGNIILFIIMILVRWLV